MKPLELVRLLSEFQAPSWSRWRAILALIVATVRSLYINAGRGSGKSRIVALLAVAFAVREYRRAPGERIYVGVFAPDRKQAATTYDYIAALLKTVCEQTRAEKLIERETAERIDLCNGVTIEVLTASKAAPRSRSYALAIIEEAAYLETDEESADPDVELLRALRPALARVPGSLLVVVSSPFAQRGILHAAAERHAAGTAPARELYVTGTTLELNPTFDEQAVADAYAEDPTGARTEYGAEFRNDIDTFMSVEAVAAVTVAARRELPPLPSIAYVGFLDFAGGSGRDSATLAIAHAVERDGQRVGVLDLVREVRPPFSPESVCRQFAAELRRYRITGARADRFAGDFPAEQMKKAGISVEPAEHSKSDLYLALLPLVNSRRVELLDLDRLRGQLTALERRTARGGRDSVDHPRGRHDDLANAVAGALTIAVAEPRFQNVVWGTGRLAVNAGAGAGTRTGRHRGTAQPSRRAELLRRAHEASARRLGIAR